MVGTPLGVSEEERLKTFQRGWNHTWSHKHAAGPSPGGGGGGGGAAAEGGVVAEPCVGYYIGRDHSPHCRVKVVRSTERGEEGYMVQCEAGPV